MLINELLFALPYLLPIIFSMTVTISRFLSSPRAIYKDELLISTGPQKEGTMRIKQLKSGSVQCETVCQNYQKTVDRIGWEGMVVCIGDVVELLDFGMRMQDGTNKNCVNGRNNSINITTSTINITTALPIANCPTVSAILPTGARDELVARINSNHTVFVVLDGVPVLLATDDAAASSSVKVLGLLLGGTRVALRGCCMLVWGCSDIVPVWGMVIAEDVRKCISHMIDCDYNRNDCHGDCSDNTNNNNYNKINDSNNSLLLKLFHTIHHTAPPPAIPARLHTLFLLIKHAYFDNTLLYLSNRTLIIMDAERVYICLGWAVDGNLVCVKNGNRVSVGDGKINSTVLYSINTATRSRHHQLDEIFVEIVDGNASALDRIGECVEGEEFCRAFEGMVGEVYGRSMSVE